MGFAHIKHANFKYDYDNVLSAVRETALSGHHTQKTVTRSDAKKFWLVLSGDFVDYAQHNTIDGMLFHRQLLGSAERAELAKVKAAIVGRGQVLTFDSEKAACKMWLSDDLNLSLSPAQFFEIEQVRHASA